MKVPYQASETRNSDSLSSESPIGPSSPVREGPANCGTLPERWIKKAAWGVGQPGSSWNDHVTGWIFCCYSWLKK